MVFKDGDSIENLFSSDEYRKLCETVYDWAQKGYIMKDAATTTESAGSLMKRIIDPSVFHFHIMFSGNTICHQIYYLFIAV